MNKYVMAGFTALAGLGVAKAGNDKKPNILYIMSDDHSAQAVSAYGGILADVMPTPNLDRIGNEGAILNHCYVTNSISTPSRAAILTGQYSQCNGVYTLGDALSREHPNVAKELRELGYSTAIVGKWHLGTEPAGFDYYNVLPGQGVYHNPVLIEKGKWNTKGDKHEGHCTDVITDITLDYLDTLDKGKPFFLMCHFKAPHRPWQPAERFKSLLADVTVPEPDNLLDTYEGKGEYAEDIRMALEYMNHIDLKTAPRKDLSRDEFRRWAYQIYIKDYLRCIAGVDENVGRILDYLDEKGLAENTIVIYTGDQGFFLGEHGWFDKRLMYEESLRMPFLIRYPKEIKPGTKVDGIVTNVDFAPLFMDYAGSSKPSYMQGESFRRNLKTGRTPDGWRDAMYYRYWMQGDGAHNATASYGIRTERYKLVFYYARALGHSGTSDSCLTPVWELYDMAKDPSEMRNIYEEKKSTRLVRGLKRKLLDLKESCGDGDSVYPEMERLAEEYYW